jgi:tellurite resistance protein
MIKAFAAIAIAAVTLSGCTSEAATRGSAEIELRDLSGDWTPVITVHGYYDNEDAAKDIVRGLVMVSRSDGTAVRTYRVRP